MAVIFNYFMELSKYFIALLLGLYSFISLVALFLKKPNHSFFIVSFQRMIIVFLQILMFCTMMVIKEDPIYLAFFLFVEMFLAICITMMGLLYKHYHRVLTNHMCLLLSVGLCMISRLSFPKAVKQYCIIIISFAISLLIPYAIHRISKLRNWKWIFCGIGIVMLAVVLLLGTLTNGANISFSVIGIKFQPSEFVKLIYIFFLAASLQEDTSLLNLFVTSLFAGIHVIILVLSTDLGTALIFFIAYLFVIYISTEKAYYFIVISALGTGLSVIAYKLFSHVRVRVLAWLDPWTYIDNQGYQITQSLFAISSGSVFGLGLSQGNPTAIPYVDSDSIFSAICEEMGLFAAICIIVICLCAFITMAKIVMEANEKFYRILGFGMAVTYVFQIFLTTGGSTKFIPLTGVTLPLVSYGGSSVMTTIFLFAVIQGVYIRCQDPKMNKASEHKKTPNNDDKYEELYEWIERQTKRNLPS